MGGGLMQLVAFGPADGYATGNPYITFFEKPTIKTERPCVKSDDTCIICFECMSNDEAIDCVCCKKVFHTKCIETWTKMKYSCPHCRTVWKKWKN